MLLSFSHLREEHLPVGWRTLGDGQRKITRRPLNLERERNAPPPPPKVVVEPLYNADPLCHHVIEWASGGGVRCCYCPGWFCY